LLANNVRYLKSSSKVSMGVSLENIILDSPL
jgi:hypothetical protein